MGSEMSIRFLRLWMVNRLKACHYDSSIQKRDFGVSTGQTARQLFWTFLRSARLLMGSARSMRVTPMKEKRSSCSFVGTYTTPIVLFGLKPSLQTTIATGNGIGI